MPKSRAPLYAGIAIVAILAGAMSAQFMRAPGPPNLKLGNGTLLPTARAVPDFQLLDGNAQAYSRTQLSGHWSLLFFGYTSCPDICPTTLSTLVQVDKQLAALPASQRLQMVFVSVDPQRDTPAQVGQYVKFFSPGFIGLTGTQQQIEPLTQAMGVPVAIHDSGNGAYTVDHAATLFLLDPQARMTAVFSPPHDVATLASDLRTVISQLTQ
jgi:protein SCO1